MTTTREAIESLPITPRPAQLIAADLIDAAEGHISIEAPTGVGKSWIAYGAADAPDQGGIIIMHSNGLTWQYKSALEQAGMDFALLAGARHYQCPKFHPSNELPPQIASWLAANDGCFIGSGMSPTDYVQFSVVPHKNQDGGVSPCAGCQYRSTCPLWKARDAAQNTRVVITNAAMLAVALRLQREMPVDEAVGDVYDPTEEEIYDGDLPGEEIDVPWPVRIMRHRIVIDEADSCESLIRQILIPSISIKAGYKGCSRDESEKAATSPNAALRVLQDWADPMRASHQMHTKAKQFLDRLGDRSPEVEVEESFHRGTKLYKTTLQLPNKLDRWWDTQQVIAMSATFTEAQSKWLGLPVETVHQLPSLDVSNCSITVHNDAPKWKYGEIATNGWAEYVADVLAKETESGQSLGLFQSRADINAIIPFLDKLNIPHLTYLADTDRPSIIAAFRAGEVKLVLGCFAGAGRGIDLPGDLLKNVVITRVPQKPPYSLKSPLQRARWKEETNAAVVQGIGRAVRFDLDRGDVQIIGGFGERYDIRNRLIDRGWKLGSK